MKRNLFLMMGLLSIAISTINLKVTNADDYPPTTWMCTTTGDIFWGYCNILPPNHPDGDMGTICDKNGPSNAMPCNGEVGVFDEEEPCENCG